MDTNEINTQISEAIRIGSFSGFVTGATFVVGFNKKAIDKLFGENSKIGRFLVMFSAAILIMVIIYMFSAIFDKKTSFSF